MFKLNKKRGSLLAASAIIPLFLATSALSKEDETSTVPQQRETVIVYGNDNSAKNPARLPKSARVSSQVLTTEDIEKLQPRDVFDLLNYGTGVFTTTTGKKSPSNLNLRGDGNYAFIIDGAYMPSFLAARVLQSLPVASIEETRIVRTSSALTLSPLVGLAAPSGAANNGFVMVRTRTPRKTEGMARIYGGSFGTLSETLQTGTAKDFAGGSLYANAMISSNTTDGPDGYNLFRQSNSFLVKTGYVGDKLDLNLTYIYDDANFGFERSNAKLQDSTYLAKWSVDPLKTTIVSLGANYRWNDSNTTLITASTTRSDSLFIQESFANSSKTVLINDNRFTNLGFRHNTKILGSVVQFGFDNIKWHTPSGQFYYEGIERKEEVNGYVVQIDRGFLDNKLNLDVAYRQDKVELISGIDYYNPGRGPQANIRKISNVKLPAADFFSLGASFRLLENLVFNSRYGYSKQGARQDVTPFPGEVLEGETKNKYEFGFQYSLNDLLRPSVNYFQVETENEVAPKDYVVINNIQTARYANTDSKRTGFEAVLEGNWGTNNSGNYRLSMTQFIDVLDPSGLLAKTQPKTVAEVMVTQNLNDWRGTISAKYVSEYSSNAFARCPTPTGVCAANVTAPFMPIGDYLNVDASIAKRFEVAGYQMRATFSVKNLTDEIYETSLGYPSIGRAYGLELVAAF